MKYQVGRGALVFSNTRQRQSKLRLFRHIAAQLTNQIDDRHNRRRLQDSSRVPIHSGFSFVGNKREHAPLHTGRNGPTTLHFPRPNHSIQARSIASWAPEFVQDFSVWGGTGVVLKSLHTAGLPYWTSFSAMNFMLRASLLPLVVYGAHTAARYAKVAPEIQFIVTLFQNDLKKMKAEGKSLFEQRNLFLQNLETVRSIYKLHNINPLTVFLSPFLQIPFFYYVATDLRKIVNGSDPELAQELTESSFLWVPDLTDPDPWFGLPIAAGAMLYFNVEVAIGKRSLSGPSASKSDFAGLLKDLFQTLAVFMPCFSAQSPAGLQIYLVSSFTWTLFQGAALRNDTMRGWVNLPAMGNPPTEPKFAKEFMEFKKLEQKAREIRGDGPVLGRNVLAVGFETSFPGTNRPSTIRGSDLPPPVLDDEAPAEVSKVPKLSMQQASAAWGGQYMHGISAPMSELEDRMMDELREERVKEVASHKLTTEKEKFMAQGSEADMKAANLGVKMTPSPPETPQSPTFLDPESFKRRRGGSSTSRRRGKNKTKRKR